MPTVTIQNQKCVIKTGNDLLSEHNIKTYEELETVLKKAKALDIVKEELGIDVALRYPDNQPMLAVFNNGFEVVRKPISKEKYDLLNGVLK